MKLPVFVIAGLMFARLSHAEVDAQSIAFNCRNCHGQDASEARLAPLEQLSAQQMRQTLSDYKYDKKPATLMPRIAKGYSDEELNAVADYLGRR